MCISGFHTYPGQGKYANMDASFGLISKKENLKLAHKFSQNFMDVPSLASQILDGYTTAEAFLNSLTFPEFFEQSPIFSF